MSKNGQKNVGKIMGKGRVWYFSSKPSMVMLLNESVFASPPRSGLMEKLSQRDTGYLTAPG